MQTHHLQSLTPKLVEFYLAYPKKRNILSHMTRLLHKLADYNPRCSPAIQPIYRFWLNDCMDWLFKHYGRLWKKNLNMIDDWQSVLNASTSDANIEAPPADLVAIQNDILYLINYSM